MLLLQAPGSEVPLSPTRTLSQTVACGQTQREREREHGRRKAALKCVSAVVTPSMESRSWNADWQLPGKDVDSIELGTLFPLSHGMVFNVCSSRELAATAVNSTVNFIHG